MIQDAWISGIKWDDPMEGVLLESWLKFSSSFVDVNEVQIPRAVTLPGHVVYMAFLKIPRWHLEPVPMKILMTP